MRVDYDEQENRAVAKAHGVSLADAAEIFGQAYIVDRKSDNPEQYRAIGWCAGRLCSGIYEIRHDADGEYYDLITAWKATQREEDDYAENT